jgi:hypothetical protein
MIKAHESNKNHKPVHRIVHKHLFSLSLSSSPFIAIKIDYLKLKASKMNQNPFLSSLTQCVVNLQPSLSLFVFMIYSNRDERIIIKKVEHKEFSFLIGSVSGLIFF